MAEGQVGSVRRLRLLWTDYLKVGSDRVDRRELRPISPLIQTDCASLPTVRQRLAETFTPSRPLSGLPHRTGQSLVPIFGREAERARAVRVLMEDHAHLLIFGDRGLGKTSLANVVVEQVQSAGVVVARHVCSVEDDFDTIMRRLVAELPSLRMGVVTDIARPGISEEKLLPESALRPADVLDGLAHFRRLRLLLVLDEFDRIADQQTRSYMADLLKQCSDRHLPLSFLIIGVSDSAEQLIGQHPSIQRCLSRIALPLLTDADLDGIVMRGEDAGLTIPAPARACITRLSLGLPYMAQLLALRAGQAALAASRTTVEGADILAAINAAATESDPSVQEFYQRVTSGEQDTRMLRLLRAAATGNRDAFGHFKVDGADRRTVDPIVAGAPVDRATLARALDVGAIRRVPNAPSSRYAFGAAMLPHLVMQRLVLTGLRTA